MRILKSSFIMVLAASALLISGCNRKTPAERLATAIQFYQQGDPMAAEIEALKVVEKAPEDPAALQANMLLAQIYSSQGRNDEAEIQLEAALQNVSQLDPMGKDVLKMYLGLLTNEKKYKKALETVEQYQKQYAEDDGTSLSLTIAGVDLRTAAGETTPARELLQSVVDRTTEPAEMTLYRGMMLQTYMKDKNSTAAVDYMEKQLAQAKDQDSRQNIMLALASLYSSQENYERSRFYLDAITTNFSSDLTKQKDPKARAAMALQLAQAYQNLSNLPGAHRIYQAVYDSGQKDPQLVGAAVLGLAENLLMSGETSATIALLEKAVKEYPKAQFEKPLESLKGMIAKGDVDKIAPELTGTLVMNYRNDPNVLWPSNLPELLGKGETSGTVVSTDSIEVKPVEPAPDTATSASETAATSAPAVEVTPAPAVDVTPAPAVDVTQAAVETTPMPVADVTPAPAQADAGTSAPM